MASMNNWLGFSLSPQEIPSQPHQDHSQNTVPRLDTFSSEELSGTDVSGDCFDLSSHASTIPSLNLPAPFGILEAFNRNNQSQDWSFKELNMNSNTSYKTAGSEMSMLMGRACNNNNHNLENQEPKLENFLGVGGQNSLHLPSQTVEASSSNGNGTIGLSMIKNWLRNNPSTSQPENKIINGNDGVVVCSNNAQNLSLSMSTGSQSTSALPLLTAASCSDGEGGGGESSTSDNTNTNKQQNGGIGITSLDSQSGAIEAVPRKSIDTFGQRTSIYRGVTRHRWTGRYEAHLWDNSCRREGQTRKGRQGGYDKEEKAARAYDLAALKYWGTTTTTNFPISNYEKEIEEMKHMTRQEYVASLRRKSSGFSRGASIYRGVTRHHQHGRWQARIGRVAGNKDLYLGTFSTQEEAAEAYDIAAIKFRGLNAVTNFEISRYDVKSILESSTLPIGGAAKRLKDAEQAEMALDAHRTNNDNLSSHLTDGMSSYGAQHAWPTIAFQQAQPLTMHYPYGQQQRLWCKQENDSDVSHSFHDLHQLQLGNTHNFLQPSVLHNLMSLDSSSMEHSSSCNSVIYSNGSNDNAAYQGVGYGSSSSYLLPMSTTVIAEEGSQNQGNGFGENGVKAIGYENMFGSSDPYQTRNFYYHPLPSSNGTLRAGLYDQGSSCNTWVPTGVPTLVARTNNMAVCHGSSTFTVGNDT
ncbi:AP2-like ethylene-responsive transcription factor BBM [Coffea eugenioides]|uniref:AP2-like ethylene-responsive transcription factor BBM n=1 Tax=Coffea eugenioides TaxID=49369 RepID=UPI000F60C3DB|nr:AP2-like ethylene-responsive transcription factor BBM [Coffea eugenioides]